MLADSVLMTVTSTVSPDRKIPSSPAFSSLHRFSPERHLSLHELVHWNVLTMVSRPLERHYPSGFLVMGPGASSYPILTQL